MGNVEAGFELLPNPAISIKAAPLRSAAAPGSALEGPARRTPGQRAQTPLINRLITSAAQDAMRRHFSVGSVVAVRQSHPVNRQRQGYGAMGTGASSAPDCVAFQAGQSRAADRARLFDPRVCH